MSDKDWLFYATIVSVKEPTKSNKRKNLQIKVCYEGYRGPYANATVKHKSIIHVLPPHKDITELERPKFALSYQAENIAPFKRAGDDKSNDHGILGPVHCTFTMWGRRNALVEWEGLTSPMDFTVAEIEKETQSGVIKLKYGTNTIWQYQRTSQTTRKIALSVWIWLHNVEFIYFMIYSCVSAYIASVHPFDCLKFICPIAFSEEMNYIFVPLALSLPNLCELRYGSVDNVAPSPSMFPQPSMLWPHPSLDYSFLWQRHDFHTRLQRNPISVPSPPSTFR